MTNKDIAKEKYLFNEDQYGNCLEKCNVLNDGTMIGSVKCQQCKHCIGVATPCELTGSVEWIACSKLDKAIGKVVSE